MDWSVVTKPLAAAGIRHIFALLERRDLAATQDESKIALRLQQHLAQAGIWASDIQFFGMTAPKETVDDTIPLRVGSIPRRFRGHGAQGEYFPETDLLRCGAHHLLLGDPGSGKTTTLKRLVLYLLREDTSHEDPWNYPLLLRLRNVDPRLDVYEMIAHELGIEYKARTVNVAQAIKHALGRAGAQEEAMSQKLRTRIQRDIERRAEDEHMLVDFVGKERLSDVIARILNESQAILVIDGLDELPLSAREHFESSLQELALMLSSSKILVSCRSGDHSRQLQGFKIVELCPLDNAQTHEVATKWLSDPGQFLEELNGSAFLDLASRPLFLCQLIVYYSNVGYLPDRAASVYQTIVRLLLEDWDRRRDVHRGSRYAKFQADEKLEFLAAVAYALTFKVRTKRFSRQEMRMVYNDIHRTFDLPSAEMEEVVTELETHTGILVESGPEHYEFSHLSLQEFLCAHYIVREPFADRMEEYFKEYPAPLAVATSLAANPSMWFAALILRRVRGVGPTTAAIRSFLSRLVQERPRLVKSIYLGFAVIDMMAKTDVEAAEEILEFLSIPSVADSTALALESYVIEYANDDPLFAHLRLKRAEGWELSPRGRAKLPRSLLREVQARVS